MRLLRLFRLVKAHHGNAQQPNVFAQWLEKRGGVALARVALYAGTALLFLHLAACAWWLVAVTEEGDNNPDSTYGGTWVELVPGLGTAPNIQK